jgi:tetratricopeptide (TPR) repeat protein
MSNPMDKLGIESDDLESVLLRARADFDAGRFTDAITGFEAVVRMTPASAADHLAIGLACKDLGRGDQALAAINEAARLDPLDPEVHCELGILNQITGRNADAEAAYGRALALQPDHPKALSGLCWVLRRLERFDEAIAAGALAVALEPSLEAYHHLLHAYLAKDDCAGALSVCDQGLHDVPYNTSALTFKIAALEGLGRHDDYMALTDIEHLLWPVGIEAPAGYDSVEQLNADLVDHVLGFPQRPFDKTQTRNLSADPTGPMVAFTEIIDDAIHAYLDSFAPTDPHPYLAQRPADWVLDSWGTRLYAMAEQEPHFHQHAWVSGVYYARVPEVVRSGAERNDDGHIEFSRTLQYSSRPVMTEAAVLQPEAGLLVLFPSFLYHRVLPFESPNIRVSIAFNAAPKVD